MQNFSRRSPTEDNGKLLEDFDIIVNRPVNHAISQPHKVMSNDMTFILLKKPITIFNNLIFNVAGMGLRH